MLIATLVILIFTAIASLFALLKGKDIFFNGINSGLKLFVQTLPLLFLALILAGLIQQLLPKELINKWIGKESGFRGILLGCIAGGLTPGGPYTSYPIMVGLVKAGAGIGTIISFITAWSLWAITRLPIEIGLVGWKITVVRLICTITFPPLAGLIANLLFSRWF